MAYQVTVKTNIDTDFILQAKKCASSSHGMSMMALSMVDANHRDLNMTVTFDNYSTLEDCAEQMTAVWAKCESNKVLFRSVKNAGEFQTEYFNYPLSEVTTFPFTSAEYKYAKVILDIDLNIGHHVYTFYRWNEPRPRILTLKTKEESKTE